LSSATDTHDEERDEDYDKEARKCTRDAQLLGTEVLLPPDPLVPVLGHTPDASPVCPDRTGDRSRVDDDVVRHDACRPSARSPVDVPRFRIPPVSRQGDTGPPAEVHTFSLQQETLFHFSKGLCALADTSPGVDHAVPRHVRSLGQRVERIAHETRLTRKPRERCHLTVGSHTPSGDAAHNTMDPVIGV